MVGNTALSRIGLEKLKNLLTVGLFPPTTLLVLRPEFPVIELLPALLPELFPPTRLLLTPTPTLPAVVVFCPMMMLAFDFKVLLSPRLCKGSPIIISNIQNLFPQDMSNWF